MDGEMDATEVDEAELEQRLAALIGRPMGSAGALDGPDPVNQPMIRHWAAAFEDHNPVYTDEAVAATTRFGEVVAPPLMLQTWTMATPLITGIAERGGSPVVATEVSPLAVFDEAGFVGTLASNTEFDILRYLRLGETVSASTVIESISPRKQTRIGPGYFVTWVTTYVAGSGDVVGRQRFRILKFRPESPS
jgi:acyl dehydratase